MESGVVCPEVGESRTPTRAALAAGAVWTVLTGEFAVRRIWFTRWPAVRAALSTMDSDIPVVWDPHPRGDDPVPGARVVTPNESEAVVFGRRALPADSGPELPVDALRDYWKCDAVAVTLGRHGALVSEADGHRRVGVPIGAGVTSCFPSRR